MTLKSFYSCNHRLPSPWIRAVTPAPACLPPQLPKLPAGRQTGRLPSYCQRGQGRGRTGWERFDATHNHTESQPGRERFRKTDRYRKRKEQTPVTKDRHRPLTARTAQIRPLPGSHTFLIQIHHSGSTRHSPIYKHIQNTDTNHKQTPYYIPSIHNSEYTYSQIYRDKSNFRYVLRFIRMYICNADTYKF